MQTSSRHLLVIRRRTLGDRGLSMPDRPKNDRGPENEIIRPADTIPADTDPVPVSEHWPDPRSHHRPRPGRHSLPATCPTSNPSPPEGQSTLSTGATTSLLTSPPTQPTRGGTPHQPWHRSRNFVQSPFPDVVSPPEPGPLRPVPAQHHHSLRCCRPPGSCTQSQLTERLSTPP